MAISGTSTDDFCPDFKDKKFGQFHQFWTKNVILETRIKIQVRLVIIERGLLWRDYEKVLICVRTEHSLDACEGA